MQMPWGKHKGTDLSQVPDSYLMWVLDNCERVGPTLRRAIEERLGLRAEPEPQVRYHAAYSPSGGTDTSRIEADIQTLRRRYAAAYHPDRGGSTEAMQAVNCLCDDILKAVRWATTGAT